MTTFQISFSDEKARLIKERAAECGLSVEEAFDRMAEEFVKQPTAEFDAIAKRVLSKNKELYRRLAK